MMVSTSSAVSSATYTAPSQAAQLGDVLGNLATTGLAAYNLYEAAQLGGGSNARFKQGLATADLINSVAAGSVVLAPFAGLQAIANVQLGLAHDYFANQKAKHEARRALRNAGFSYAKSVAEGQAPVIAARLAIAKIGLNPEQFVPLGSPYAQFSPRTGATDTVEGLIADFGDSPEADALRERRAIERGNDLSSRRASGYGMVPPALGRFRRG